MAEVGHRKSEAVEVHLSLVAAEEAHHLLGEAAGAEVDPSPYCYGR